MISKILSATVIGLEAEPVYVEVHFARGKSKFFIVGLPDKACSESKERVSAIIRNYRGCRIPAGTFTVNLAPADILKSGPVYDVAIAIGMLQSLGEIDVDMKGRLLFGELSLDGRTRHTRAILPIADMVRSRKIRELFVPYSNVKEACMIPDITVYGVRNLAELVEHLTGRKLITAAKKELIVQDSKRKEEDFDFSVIRGQEHAKRALEIAAAGAHNVLMSGSPGSGKTLLSRTLPTILPDMAIDEQLEVTRIYSVAGMLAAGGTLLTCRPFRKPHHTISHVALVGGGTIPHPGEISLAHRGVLFLDEFTEFSQKALESLRQPLEDGIVTISRAKGSATFPARIMLVAAMNPCKCGWLGDEKRECTCAPSEIIRYKKKISGPILDRIDMHIDVKRVEFKKLQKSGMSESSDLVRKRVQSARKMQNDRFGGALTNSEMTQKDIGNFITLDDVSKRMLRKAVEVLGLSARSYFRMLRVARTIADLDQSEQVKAGHISEALSFRMSENL